MTKELENRLKELFDDEQKLGINESDRYHNTEKGSKEWEYVMNAPKNCEDHVKPNLFKRINGWLRLYVFGVCPECNHDAPELYDCKVCNYYESLPRYKSEQTQEQKKHVWNTFIYGPPNAVKMDELKATLKKWKQKQ